jgi:hypothetical protein
MANNQYSFKTTLDRFMSHVRVLSSGCWEWTGHLNNGYGKFWIDGRPMRNPRAAWTVQRGPVPKGLEPDHLCRYRPCVNCDHMELVTHLENVRRGNAGKHLLDRTHCAKGHPYTERNTRVRIQKNGNPRRTCRTCEAESDRRRRPERYADPISGPMPRYL